MNDDESRRWYDRLLAWPIVGSAIVIKPFYDAYQRLKK